jgi:rsbT antagonist protein RsbS
MKVPLIKIGDKLLVSIQTTIIDSVVASLREDITNEISTSGVKGLIIDLSGIDIIDSFFCRMINDIGHDARILGAKTVVVGIKPELAVTLVQMGMEMRGVMTSLNLNKALEILK